jgi:hypothetical protein
MFIAAPAISPTHRPHYAYKWAAWPRCSSGSTKRNN